jgi:hypothetical protein
MKRGEKTNRHSHDENRAKLSRQAQEEYDGRGTSIELRWLLRATARWRSIRSGNNWSRERRAAPIAKRRGFRVVLTTVLAPLRGARVRGDFTEGWLFHDAVTISLSSTLSSARTGGSHRVGPKRKRADLYRVGQTRRGTANAQQNVD